MDNPPHLRLVEPSDESASATAEAPSAPVRTGPRPGRGPTTEYAALRERLAAIGSEARDPLMAAYLAGLGCKLSDLAVDFHHHAAAHAMVGVFRRSAPPGLRSAEAARAWVEAHARALKDMSRRGERGPYEREDDLLDSVAHSAKELDRAHERTREAGLWFDERRAGIYADANRHLDVVGAFVRSVRGKQRDAAANPHLIGTAVVAYLASRR